MDGLMENPIKVDDLGVLLFQDMLMSKATKSAVGAANRCLIYARKAR